MKTADCVHTEPVPTHHRVAQAWDRSSGRARFAWLGATAASVVIATDAGAVHHLAEHGTEGVGWVVGGQPAVAATHGGADSFDDHDIGRGGHGQERYPSPNQPGPRAERCDEGSGCFGAVVVGGAVGSQGGPSRGDASTADLPGAFV